VVLGASGDFNVTRATTATRVNASGLIEVVPSGIPRLDYPLGGGCPALLVEPSGTNLALQSENFATTWSSVALLSFGSGSVLNTTGTLDPYGTNVADLIVPNTTLNQHRLDQTTVSASGSYTFSVFLKAAGYNFVRLRIGSIGSNFNLVSGTITATDTGIVSAIQSYGNGWYRCIISKASSVANEIIRINVGNSASVPDFEGNGTSGIYVFGSQYELGTVATSYILTTTASATRNADVITLSGAVSGCIGQTEGTIYAEVDIQFANKNADIIGLDSGSSANGFYLVIRSSSVIELRIRQNSTNALIFQRTGAYPVGINKIAVSYKNGDFAISLNGTAAQVDTSTITMPSVAITRASVVPSINFTLDQSVKVRAAALYTTRLTNAELAALTTL